MPQTQLPYYEAAILRRIVGPDELSLSAATAKGILALEFNQADKECMTRLAAKARAGTLSDDEQAQIEAYSRLAACWAS